MAALSGIEGSTSEPIRSESKTPLTSVPVAGTSSSSSYTASIAVPLTASKEVRDALAEIGSMMPNSFNSALQDAVVDHLHADNESWNSETGVYEKTNGVWNDQKPFHEVLSTGGSYFAHQPSCQPPSVTNAITRRISVDVCEGITMDVLKETNNGAIAMMSYIPTGKFFWDISQTSPYKRTGNPEDNPSKLSVQHYDSMLQRVSAIPGSVVETGSLQVTAGVAMGHPVLVGGRIAPKKWYVRDLTSSPVNDFSFADARSNFGLSHVPLPGCSRDNNSGYRHDLYNNEAASGDRWLGRFIFLQSLDIVNYLTRVFKDPGFKTINTPLTSADNKEFVMYAIPTWTKDASSRHHDPSQRAADDIRLDWIMWMVKHFNSVIKTATAAELSQSFKFKVKSSVATGASSSSSSSSDEGSEMTGVLSEIIGRDIEESELPDAKTRMYVRVSNQTIIGILLTIRRVLVMRHKVGDFRPFFHKLGGAPAGGSYSNGVPSYDGWGTMALTVCVKPVHWYNKALVLMQEMERKGISSADLSVKDRLLYFNATKPINISMVLQVSIIPLSLFGNLKHLEMTDFDRTYVHFAFESGGDIAPLSRKEPLPVDSDSKTAAPGLVGAGDDDDDDDRDDEKKKEKKKKDKKKGAGAGTAGSSSYRMATPPVRRK